MHCHSHRAQVADAHDTADDISTKVIENEDFPNRVSFSVEDRGNGGQQSVGMGFFRLARLDSFVEVEDLFERRCSTPGCQNWTPHTMLAKLFSPIWRSRREFALDAMVGGSSSCCI